MQHAPTHLLLHCSELVESQRAGRSSSTRGRAEDVLRYVASLEAGAAG